MPVRKKSGTQLIWPQRAAYAVDTRTLVVDGYPYKVSTRDGHLAVTQHGQESLYPRVSAKKTTTGLSRIIVVSDQGYITGAAFTWCRMMNVNIIHCNRENKSSFTSGSDTTDALLVKRQVMAQPGMPNAHVGLEITRSLLTQKLAGQREVLTRMHASTARIDECLNGVASARSLQSLLAYEGGAAISYWSAWKDRVFVPWLPSVIKRVPVNWHRFNGRATFSRSDGRASATNETATDFCNSLLNVAYHFAQTEAIFACRIFGLHTDIGMSHGISDEIPAMAIDLMEPLRVIADMQVLSVLDYGNGLPLTADTGKPFRWDKSAAQECDNGECRLSKDVVYRIGATVSLACAPVAIDIAETIARTLTSDQDHMTVAPFDPRLHHRPILAIVGDDVTAEDIVPDHVWESVQPLIPEFGDTKHRGADTRRVLAGVVLHELYGVAWGPKIDATRFANWQTCRKRLNHWEETGAWPLMLAEITRPGISQSVSA